MKKGIQRHGSKHARKDLYISPKDIPVEYVSQEGLENTLFTKGKRTSLVIEAQILLRISTMVMFYRLGLTIGDFQTEFSFQEPRDNITEQQRTIRCKGGGGKAIIQGWEKVGL